MRLMTRHARIISQQVWSRLIRDFAAIGYDHSNLILASYDWRLSLHDMEVLFLRVCDCVREFETLESISVAHIPYLPHKHTHMHCTAQRRDHYFTILKSRIETLVKINGGRKVVLIAHSYGSNVGTRPFLSMHTRICVCLYGSGALASYPSTFQSLHHQLPPQSSIS